MAWLVQPLLFFLASCSGKLAVFESRTVGLKRMKQFVEYRLPG